MTEPSSLSEDRMPEVQRAPWQEPVRGGYPDGRTVALSGLDQLRAMIAGDTPQPPMSRLTGLRLHSADPGSASFELPISNWLAAPQGAIGIGPVMLAADAAAACAIQTVLPAATPFTTTELSLRLLAPVLPGATLTARGRLIQSRRALGLAEVTVTDERERMVAHGSSLCLMQPQISLPPSASGRPDEDPPPAEDTGGEPDPFLRSPVGRALDADVWESMSGLEILRAQVGGELPWPPIHHLTGLTPARAEAGAVTVTMPASEWFCAPARGRVQGGFVALLADAALSAAIQTRCVAGTAMAAIDLKVNYLRPLIADGRRAEAHGRVVHAGRRVVVATSGVRDADGRSIALATGSALVLPGRPASLRVPQP